MQVREVGDRVFTLHFEFFDQQIGVILGGDDVVVIDTRSTPVQAREIQDAIRDLTRQPVSIIINTHWHWDHTFGNHEFRPAPIWGHARCIDRLQARGQETIEKAGGWVPDIAADLRTVVIDPPDQIFDDVARVEAGDRELRLTYLGRGHTDTDIVIEIPDALRPGSNVLFAGDLLEEGATPAFADAYPMEWPDTVERLLPLATGAVVPGHGAVGDRGFVESQLADLRANLGLARRVHAGDLDLEAAVAASPYPAAAARAPLERALAQLRGQLD